MRFLRLKRTLAKPVFTHSRWITNTSANLCLVDSQYLLALGLLLGLTQLEESPTPMYSIFSKILGLIAMETATFKIRQIFAYQSVQLEEEFARYIWNQYRFPADLNQMYYFNRDLCSEFNRQSNMLCSELGGGFCKKLKFQSEIDNGMVFIDGFSTHNLSIGDTFTLECRPEHLLKCIRFI